MNNRSSSLFSLTRLVRVIKKFLLVLGLLKRLDSESTCEVVRHLISGWGRTKLFFLIQGYNIYKVENLLRSKESLDDLV